MPTNLLMPQLGESVVEGTISKWLKQEGEPVNEFDPLVEVNTDKVDTEIPAPASGVLLRRLVAEGTTVRVGTPLAVIGEPGETLAEAVAEAAKTDDRRPTTDDRGASAVERDLGFISPVVAKIAEENRVDLRQVKGTGQGGRITRKDVMEYLEAVKAGRAPVGPAAPAAAPTPPPAWQPAPPPAPVPAPAAALPGTTLPLSTIRKAVAEHMLRSKHTSPHVTTVMEADLSRVARHRQANKEAFARDGVNLTFTAYFVAASVAALKAHPIVNSSWGEDKIVLHRPVNIGVAVSLGEDGLIVPVIKDADHKSLLKIAADVNDLADRARARRLKPDDVQGGTFTITNHGVSGSLFATPIISQPQCAILGVGAVQKRVVVVDDAIAIRPMAYLSLTFDHRILDGAIADYFLGKVVETLQSWS